MKGIFEVANNSTTLAICKTVTYNPPLNGTNGNGQDRWHKGRQAIARMRVASVCDADGGNDGPAEDGADKNEQGVGEGASFPASDDC